MNQKIVRGWIMYDWANSAFATTIMAAVFPIFYQNIAVGAGLGKTAATSYYAYTNAIAMLVIVALAPILGAIADVSGWKMRFLRGFAYLGIAASAAMVFIGNGDYLLASVLFIFGMIGFSGGNTFYDSLLTDIVPRERRDMVSAQGFALGYVGGGVLLAVNLAMILYPKLFGFSGRMAATQATFVTVAVWWLLFSLPLFTRLRGFPPQEAMPVGRYVAVGFSRIWQTLRKLGKYPELLKYLIAFWLFNDGITTVITMATAYGNEIGIDTNDLIAALLITQFVGIPFTLLFGRLAERIGAKASLYISLGVYVAVVAFGFFMTNAAEFYALAIVVGMVQGGSQSIARSIYSKLVPVKRSAEFFGFLSISSKFSSILGPGIFGVVGQLSGSSRWGIVSLLAFFLGGLILLRSVNLPQGEAQAHAEE